jgi:hypothetical protein
MEIIPFGERYSSTLLLRSTLAIVISFLAALLVIYFAHAFVGPVGKDVFSPRTCVPSPSDQINLSSTQSCWDAYSKYGYPLCTVLQHPAKVRGILHKAGEKVCYKSIYFNVESTTFTIAAIFLFWALITVNMPVCIVDN